MVADETSVLQNAERLQPTVAIVALSLARGEGLQWLPRLRSPCPGLKLSCSASQSAQRMLRGLGSGR
jgi:DNA-binding NarL/FixJ family response regulator